MPGNFLDMQCAKHSPFSMSVYSNIALLNCSLDILSLSVSFSIPPTLDGVVSRVISNPRGNGLKALHLYWTMRMLTSLMTSLANLMPTGDCKMLSISRRTWDMLQMQPWPYSRSHSSSDKFGEELLSSANNMMMITNIALKCTDNRLTDRQMFCLCRMFVWVH